MFIQVMQGSDVLPGNDQEVHRRLRIDILEGDRQIVLIQALRGDLPGSDLAEQTLHGGAPDRRELPV